MSYSAKQIKIGQCIHSLWLKDLLFQKVPYILFVKLTCKTVLTEKQFIIEHTKFNYENLSLVKSQIKTMHHAPIHEGNIQNQPLNPNSKFDISNYIACDPSN